MSDYYRPGCVVRLRRPTNHVNNEDFLIHYGIKGQKKGQRRFQNEDGSYTSEGLDRYRQMYGHDPRQPAKNTATVPTGRTHRSNVVAPTVRPRRSSATAPVARIRRSNAASQMTKKQRSQAAANSIKSKQTPEQLKARRAKAKKILAISAGVAVAAALGYAAYKGSTNLRDQMRKQILTEQGKGYESINTRHSKYWNAADRAKYSAMTKERAQMLANNTTRRDALAAKFYQKTGYQINLPQSRARVLQERRSSQELGKFIRDAENRGHTNKQIHDARANLKAAQKKLATYQSTEHIGNSKQYEALWGKKYAENVDKYRDILNDLLNQRARRAA